MLRITAPDIHPDATMLETARYLPSYLPSFLGLIRTTDSYTEETGVTWMIVNYDAGTKAWIYDRGRSVDGVKNELIGWCVLPDTTQTSGDVVTSIMYTFLIPEM